MTIIARQIRLLLPPVLVVLYTLQRGGVLRAAAGGHGCGGSLGVCGAEGAGAMTVSSDCLGVRLRMVWNGWIVCGDSILPISLCGRHPIR